MAESLADLKALAPSPHVVPPAFKRPSLGPDPNPLDYARCANPSCPVDVGHNDAFHGGVCYGCGADVVPFAPVEPYAPVAPSLQSSVHAGAGSASASSGYAGAGSAVALPQSRYPATVPLPPYPLSPVAPQPAAPPSPRHPLSPVAPQVPVVD